MSGIDLYPLVSGTITGRSGLRIFVWSQIIALKTSDILE